MRRALYDRMPRLRRAELHLRVAEALEQAGAMESSRGLAALAYHFGAAAPVDGPERAIEYALLAGRAALSALAFDEAAARFAFALDLGIDDPRRRAETQLELGTARFRAGGSDDAMEAFRAAAQIARDLGDATLLARAAVGFEEACWRPGITDEGAVELLEEASGALGERGLRASRHAPRRTGPRATRSSATTRRATSSGTGDHDGAPAGRPARPGDRARPSYWSLGDGSLDQTLEMLAEARDLAEGLGAERSADRGDGMARRRAHRPRRPARGPARARRRPRIGGAAAPAVRVARRRALRVDHRALRGTARRGRGGRQPLARVEPAAHRSGRDRDYGIQMFGIRREQGRLAELAPVARVLAAGERMRGVWRPAFAALLAELGMEDEARRELARVHREGRTHSLDALGGVAELSGRRLRARGRRGVWPTLLYPELTPLAGGNVVIGHGVACYGSADRYLGRLAATLGDHDRAIGHFERALAVNRAMGADTWVAHTLYEFGRALRMRGHPGDDSGPRRCSPRPRRWPSESGCPRCWLAPARWEPAAPWPGTPARRSVLARGRVLRLVAAGLSNREIGEQLSISGHTVANHVRSILRKTGAANRTEAAGYAHRNALLDTADRR